MRKIKSFKLQVNERNIGTKRFVREFIGNSLLGQIECLRLEGSQVQRVNLEIEFDEEST
jgi:hypothetical protein